MSLDFLEIEECEPKKHTLRPRQVTIHLLRSPISQELKLDFEMIESMHRLCNVWFTLLDFFFQILRQNIFSYSHLNQQLLISCG